MKFGHCSNIIDENIRISSQKGKMEELKSREEKEGTTLANVRKKK